MPLGNGKANIVTLLLLVLLASFSLPGVIHSLYSGGPDDLSFNPPTPRCSGAHAYNWFATVQHCMWISKDNHSLGNNCPLLNDTLFELVYYSGDVVTPKSNLTKNVEAVKASLAMLPEGFRIVQAQNCHKISSDPDDNLLPPYKEGAACKNGTIFTGLWWDNGVKANVEALLLDDLVRAAVLRSGVRICASGTHLTSSTGSLHPIRSGVH